MYNQGKRYEAENSVEEEARSKAMGLRAYFEGKRQQKEREGLHRLAADYRELTKGEDKKRVADASPPNSRGKLKPSTPIYRESVLRPGPRACPACGSRFIRPAGYKDRSECQDCGNVFS